MLNKLIRLRNRRFITAALVLSGFVLATTFQNCGKVGKSKDYQDSDESSASKNGGLPVIKVADIASQTTNLGTQLQIPIAINVPSDYSGTLKLEVQTPELAKVDPGQGIKFSFDKSSIALSGQTAAQATLTVNVTTLAPSFDLSLFHVHVSDAMGRAVDADVSVPLQVKAVYEVQLLGRQNPAQASPEKWSVAIGSVNKFIRHSEGLTFRFVNKDTTGHRVHSSGGPIAHEGSDMAANGGTYVINIPAAATQSTSQVYCHDHEGGGQARTFQFNVPVIPVAPAGPSGNPNATFTYINNNVFKTSCVGCHGGTNPPAGVNLSSYANVVNFVTKGDASASAIYDAVSGTNPSMPQGAPALAPALVKDIGDWINDGAANN